MISDNSARQSNSPHKSGKRCLFIARVHLHPLELLGEALKEQTAQISPLSHALKSVCALQYNKQKDKFSYVKALSLPSFGSKGECMDEFN